MGAKKKGQTSINLMKFKMCQNKPVVHLDFFNTWLIGINYIIKLLERSIGLEPIKVTGTACGKTNRVVLLMSEVRREHNALYCLHHQWQNTWSQGSAIICIYITILPLETTDAYMTGVVALWLCIMKQQWSDRGKANNKETVLATQ